MALLVRALAPEGPPGRFQALAAGLLVLAAIAAWTGVRPRAGSLGAVAIAGATLALAGLLLGASDVLGLAALAVAVALIAGGVGAAARALGTPSVAAGGAGLLVVVTAATGMLWADPFAARWPGAERGSARRLVIAHDPVLALAYGVAGHDRLHEPAIYGRVPLASSTVELPTPTSAAGRLALLGTGAAALALLAGFVKRRRVRASP